MEYPDLYWDIEVTAEDEDEIIMTVAEMIHKYGMDVAAILLIESIKPLSFVGAQVGRFFVAPFLPVFGEGIGIRGAKLFQIFEKRENVERLIKAVEKFTIEDEKQKKAEKTKRLEAKKAEAGVEEASEKTGWRRFLPF